MFSFEDEEKINVSNHYRDYGLLDGRFPCGSGHPNIGQYLVPDFKKTFFYPTELAFCSGLDAALPTDGNCGGTGMVLWHPPPLGQNGGVPLWTSTLGEWTLVIDFLWFDESHWGFGGDRGITFYDRKNHGTVQNR